MTLGRQLGIILNENAFSLDSCKVCQRQGLPILPQRHAVVPRAPHEPPLPRDWNNEDVSFNLARRLAPKVKWPHAMDLESRTAP